jgi:hypothetical protein
MPPRVARFPAFMPPPLVSLTPRPTVIAAPVDGLEHGLFAGWESRVRGCSHRYGAERRQF